MYEVLLIGIVIGLVIGWLLNQFLGIKSLKNAKEEAQELIKNAKVEADSLKKEIRMEVEDEFFELRQSLEKEIEQEKEKAEEISKELDKKEVDIEQREEVLNKKLNNINLKEQQLEKKSRQLKEGEERLQKLLEEQVQTLEKIAGMDREQAQEKLLAEITEEARKKAESISRNIIDTATLEANRKAKEVIVSAIQQSAADQSVESTVSIISLPNDDMKGRIIGREGRNIRSFEQVTGVDVIIDDTPEIVVLSTYNPVRREIAKRTMEKLIADGRIHPARIEEMYEKTKEEMQDILLEIGEETLMELGIHGVQNELMRTIGKLKFMTSYGQNVLNHSLEVAHLCGLMASELGLDADIAKRAGLLHDIGKALENYSLNNHAQLGADYLKKLGEIPQVVNAVAAHHGNEEPISPYPILVEAADIISGSRPGARRESLEQFIGRMKNLEEIAKEFDGVEETFAIQAGKEVRVMVDCGKISDEGAKDMAEKIADRIQNEIEYPGQVKISVIRELRAYDVAM